MAEGYSYLLRNGGVVCATASTLLQVKAVTCSLEIMRISIGQKASTTSAIERIGIVRKSSAATVSSTTMLKMNASDPSALAVGSTSGTGITASAEGTDTDVLLDRCFNIVNGSYEWLPSLEERIRVPQAGILGLKFLTAPASQTWYAEMTVREFQ